MKRRLTAWRLVLGLAILLAVGTGLWGPDWITVPLVYEKNAPGAQYLLLLGGPDRLTFAARWAREDPRRTILLRADRWGNLVRYGIVPPSDIVAAKKLEELGIPRGRIEVIPTDPDGDWADDLELWRRDRGDVPVLVVVDRFRSAEAAMQWRRYYANAGRGDPDLPGGIWPLVEPSWEGGRWRRSRRGWAAVAGAWLDLIHAWLVGPPQPGDIPAWDAMEYTRQLAEKVAQ